MSRKGVFPAPRILMLIALALLAVTAAGCGSKPTSSGVAQLSSTTTSTTTTSQSSGSPKSKAEIGRTFSACMRSHGVRNFPDPQSSSGGRPNLTIGPSSGINPNSPQFRAASKICEKLLPAGAAPDAATQARDQAQLLKFSACMRSHGLPDFPDPVFSNGGAKLSIGGSKKGSGLNPSSPAFQAAQKACQSLMPGKGPKTSSSGSQLGGGTGPSNQMSVAP